jgi:nucleoside-diphosphate-sugar epimerase
MPRRGVFPIYLVMSHHYLITGATGFVGRHLADACRARGEKVSAIVRSGSDAAALEGDGITVFRGDFGEPALVGQALDSGADVIVHCAAKVGDRGPIEDYRPVNVDAFRRLLDPCKGRSLHRFVHMSSLGVYEARHHQATDESEPLPAGHMDSYTTTKVEADKLAQEYMGSLPLTILRPGFVYGPRDKVVLPKLIRHMARKKIHYLGADQRALNTIYISNLTDAVFLAVENPKAAGQIYNLTDGESVSKRRFIEAVADGMELKKSKQVLPYWLAALIVKLVKRQMTRALADGRKPWVTPAQFKFMQLNLDFSIEKAKRELGYQPRVSFDQGIKETIAWYKANPDVIWSGGVPQPAPAAAGS